MATNRDYRNLLQCFADEQVEFLVVGAYAVIFHAEPRYTKDLDLLVRPTAENAERVWRALERFGAPLSELTREHLQDPELVFQIGVEPNRIDILMGLTGLEFEAAWASRVESTYGDVPIHVIGKAALITAKRAAGRPQDLLDVERLEQGSQDS